MRPVSRYTVLSVMFAGALAVIAFAGVTGQEKPSSPEEEFFGVPEFFEGAPEMPMGDMPMMPPGMPGPGPGGAPMGPQPGGSTCGMQGGPGMGHPGMGPGGPGMGCPCMGMMGGGPGMMGMGPGMPGPMGGMMMHGGPPRGPGHMGPMMGGGGPKPEGMGPDHRFSVFHLLSHPLHHAEEFGLTDGERKALGALREKLLYPAIEKEKALEAARFALADTLGLPDFDSGKARDYAKKIGALENDLRDLTIQAASEVRKILGPERYGKLVRGEPEHRPPMMGMMGFHPEGRPGGPPHRGHHPQPAPGSAPSPQ